MSGLRPVLSVALISADSRKSCCTVLRSPPARGGQGVEGRAAGRWAWWRWWMTARFNTFSMHSRFLRTVPPPSHIHHTYMSPNFKLWPSQALMSSVRVMGPIT